MAKYELDEVLNWGYGDDGDYLYSEPMSKRSKRKSNSKNTKQRRKAAEESKNLAQNSENKMITNRTCMDTLLNQISSYGVDVIELGLNKGKHPKQLMEIITGLKGGLDVAKYIHCHSDKQMEQVRLGLASGVNVDKYRDNRFNDKQMEQLRIALEEGEDCEELFNPLMTSGNIMRGRELFRKGLVFSRILTCLKYTESDLELIRECWNRYKFNIMTANCGFELTENGINDCLGAYKVCRNLGINFILIVGDGRLVNDILDLCKKIRTSTATQSNVLNIIQDNDNIDIEVKLASEYDIHLMDYIDNTYTQSQAREVRLGLENNIDVTTFNDPRLTSVEMRAIRASIKIK